jgi:predicted AlkP superfamily phosphohydrolase/phosphomutase
LNLKGREENGIVSPQEADSIKAALRSSLTGLIDPGCGATAIRSVTRREEIYTGAFTHQAPDLLLNFAPPYRASWGTPLGGVPEGCFVENDKKWGGDHCIDPELVPGVLFMNRPMVGERPGLQDLAPTILDALRIPKGPAMEGQSLLPQA